MLSINQARARVVEKLPLVVYRSMLTYVEAHAPTYWSQERSRGFVEDQLIMYLLHVMYGQGRRRVRDSIDINHSVGNESLAHNFNATADVLYQWAKQHIILGTEVQWRAAARNTLRPGELAHVVLWQDSADFAIEHAPGMGKKSEFYSHKLNRPGLRYQFLCDARCVVRKVWGPLSPKLYDTHFVAAEDTFYNQIGNVHIVADQHYAKANSLDIKVTFKTRVPKPKVKRRNPVTPHLTAEQQRYNDNLDQLRARVEQPFGWMKDTFALLSGNTSMYWRDDIDLHIRLITLAVGCWNFMKNSNDVFEFQE